MSTTKKTNTQQALLALREHLGLTQRALALALDVTVVTVCRWETSRPPSGASLVRLAAFARASGEGDLAKIFSQSFDAEFHLSEDSLRLPLPRLPLFTPSAALMELWPYKYRSAIAKPYKQLLEQIERVHALLVREALTELQRAPSAEQAKTVLQLQETHELLQQEMKGEENRS
jgi:transcriptional regulator with XRE-family HTH domain